MTKSEFQAEMKTLAACFPKFKPESWSAVYGAYFDNLCHFSLPALKWACQTVIQNTGRLEYHSGEFPSAAELFGLCREYMQRQANKGDIHARFKPLAHECNPKLAKMREVYAKQKEEHKGFTRLTEPRSMLGVASWYEAKHCCCPTVGPVCPNCGLVQEPWINPLKEYLINRFPLETKEWNKFHHGLLLCGKCEVIRNENVSRG